MKIILLIAFWIVVGLGSGDCLQSDRDEPIGWDGWLIAVLVWPVSLFLALLIGLGNLLAVPLNLLKFFGRGLLVIGKLPRRLS